MCALTISYAFPKTYLSSIKIDHMEKDSSNSMRKSDNDIVPRISSDFQCFVCGAIFAKDEDRKQHREKEAHGKIRDNTTQQEMAIANHQEELQEGHRHHI